MFIPVWFLTKDEHKRIGYAIVRHGEQLEYRGFNPNGSPIAGIANIPFTDELKELLESKGYIIHGHSIQTPEMQNDKNLYKKPQYN